MRIAIAVTVLPYSGYAHAATEETKTILIVNSAEASSSSGQSIDYAMYDVLSSAKQKLEIDFEQLVPHTTPPGPLELAALSKLKNKHNGRHINLIIARGPRAMEFVERNGEYLWPDVPSMYYSVSDTSVYWRAHHRKMSGVSIGHNLAGNVALILNLQPGVKHIVQLLATSRADELLAMHTALDATVKSMRADIQVESMPDTTLPRLLKNIAALPPDTALLAMNIDPDKENERYTTDETMKEIASATTAPLYGMRGSYMRKGAIGGQVVDVREHGRQAAKLALQLLAHPTSAPIVVVSKKLHCVIDDRQVRRWKLDFANIPFACERLFHTPTFWNRYKAQIATFSALSSVILSLILGLHWQRRRRMVADEETSRQRVALAHVARLGSIGELTASIVHEINQPLGAILANADAATMMLNRQLEPHCQLSAILADIRDDNLRVSQIIKKLRVLLSKRSLESKPVSLNDVVDACKSLLGNLAIRHHATIQTSLADDLPLIMGDSTHLQQILINLASNAMDAMSAAPPAQRVLSLRTELSDAMHTRLVVADQGTGIPTNIRPDIFASFYTTKPDGMGMGLAIVQTIVETHKGSIETFNNRNGGATFVVTFPIAKMFK